MKKMMRRYLVYILMSVVTITISANTFIPPQVSESVAQYVKNNIEPTKPAIESAGRGEVVLSCCISPNGEISKVKLKYRVSERLDNAALQLVGGMPRWIPASFEGDNVEVNAEIGVSYFPTRVRLVSSSETSGSRDRRRLAKQAAEQSKASEVTTATETEPKAEGKNLLEEFFNSDNSKGGKSADITIETKEQTIQVVQPEKVAVPRSGSRIVSCNTTLNLRKAPGGAVISSINNGETVLAMEEVDDWTKINYNGTIGYVKSDYLIQDSINSDSYESSGSNRWFRNWVDDVMYVDFIFVLIGMFAVLLLFNLCTKSTASYHGLFISLYTIYFTVVSLLMILYTISTNDRAMGWICFPEHVGGWGQAIINFFLLIGVTINHIYALAMVYDRLRWYTDSDGVSFQVVNLFVTILTMIPSFIPYLCIMSFRIINASRKGAGWYYGVLIILVTMIGAYALLFLLLHMLIITIIVVFAFLILGGFANSSKYRPSSSSSREDSPRNIVAHDRCGNSVDLERIGENDYVDREGGRYHDNSGIIERTN